MELFFTVSLPLSVGWREGANAPLVAAQLGNASADSAADSREASSVAGSCAQSCAESCLALWDPMDSSPAGSSLHGIFQTKLTWGPYLWFHMLRAATSTLSVCDFLGEKIASVLGISTPKYQYAIDEYYRMKKEEEEEEEENRMSEEAERQYQQNKLQADSVVQSDQPETLASSSFVNLNFEMEGDCEVITESKQNPVSVPL
uniref:Family with sequence similarity 177 member A1 n=1 Tax=Bos taurus TaxID=9913 RepID=A0AAA9TK97_BOVIN